MEGNLRFKFDWASLIVGSKFIVFYFVLLCIPSTSPLEAYFWRGDLMEGFLSYWLGGLIFGGGLIHGRAYFRNFTVCELRNEELNEG